MNCAFATCAHSLRALTTERAHELLCTFGTLAACVTTPARRSRGTCRLIIDHRPFVPRFCHKGSPLAQWHISASGIYPIDDVSAGLLDHVDRFVGEPERLEYGDPSSGPRPHACPTSLCGTRHTVSDELIVVPPPILVVAMAVVLTIVAIGIIAPVVVVGIIMPTIIIDLVDRTTTDA